MMVKASEDAFCVHDVGMIPFISIKLGHLSSFPSQFFHLIEVVHLSQDEMHVNHHFIIATTLKWVHSSKFNCYLP
jgi:hypothetical protein